MLRQLNSPPTALRMPVARPLSAAGTCGDATGVNDDGIIVGKSCDASGIYLATLWRMDLTGPAPVLLAGPTRLPGLGLKGSSDANHSMGASKVTSTAPYTISGTAPYAGGTDALVRWQAW